MLQGVSLSFFANDMSQEFYLATWVFLNFKMCQNSIFQAYTKILATKIFEGVKTQKFPLSKTFLL